MTVDPNTPHDTLVKELLGSPGDAAAVLQTVLPADVRAAIDWTSLQRDDTELRAKNDASTHTDLLFRAKGRVGDEQHEVMVLVVIEHQSTDLLVYLTVTTKLTGPVVAAMLSKQGAQQAASTMSTLHEMWEAQQRERVFAEGKRVGELAGEREGKQKMLVKQLTLKFGNLDEPDLRRIEQADAAVLETYLERVLTADSIAAVLGPE